MKKMSYGDRLADVTTMGIGSWAFIIIQLIIILFWIVGNISGFFKFDPFPFIFLNLALSFQAAFTAPIIMMSQNRQTLIDRGNIQNDLKINTLAESEIELLMKEINKLHVKIDKLQK
jgi:uncharacterized membrane protein